jgi:SNF2 family DNA or RNA helicase
MKKPLINKVIVLAPLSVVKNWEKEFGKWLGSTRLQPLVAIGEKTDINKAIENFTQGHYRCLLTSYEVFRKQVDKLNGYCDLLILDEGHRMKNQINKTFQCFIQFNCKRRIILTGTPLQNRLEELYACCDFINPGIFPNLNSFRKVFITPIVAGLKNTANREAQSLAKYIFV